MTHCVYRVPHSGVLLGEQAASKPARQGSNPCTVAVWEYGIRNVPFQIVFGVCRIARDLAEVVDQVRFLARTLSLVTSQNHKVLKQYAL